MSYTHRFNDETRGTNGMISSFQVADLRMQVKAKSKTASALSASFFIEANNLYDLDYFIVERRPMPGRNFMAGVSFFINHQNLKQ
jgi:hypothetical protein